FFVGPGTSGVLTVDTLELGNGAPFGPDPRGPAPSLPEGKDVPNAPIQMISHHFGCFDVASAILTSDTFVSIVIS
ncbi:MAG: hypothetical protein ACKPAH_05990, partial [Verrucomicrobiota bacterium]